MGSELVVGIPQLVPPAPGTYVSDLKVDYSALDKAEKDTVGKLDLTLVPPEVIGLLAELYQYGCEKYHRESWRAGFKDSDLLAAADRHTQFEKAGEIINPESGLPHAVHAAWEHLTLAVQQMNGKGVRDIPLRPEVVKFLNDHLYPNDAK